MICIRVWFDMAQVIAVAEDERRMRKALRRSATLLRHNFLSLFWLYLRVSLIAWIVFAIGLHFWMTHLRPESILAPFLLSQFLIIFWQACRLWQRASECIWYREHQRAIAVATPVYEPPPVIFVASRWLHQRLKSPNSAALSARSAAPSSNLRAHSNAFANAGIFDTGAFTR